MVDFEEDEFNPQNGFIYVQLPNVLLEYKDLSIGAKVLWAKLAQHARGAGECWPKQDTLAQEISLAVPTIIAKMEELEEKKFIRKYIPQGEDVIKHRTNRYRFLRHKCFSDGTASPEDISLVPDLKGSEVPNYKPCSSIKKVHYNEKENTSYSLKESSKELSLAERRLVTPIPTTRQKMHLLAKDVSPSLKKEEEKKKPPNTIVPSKIQPYLDIWHKYSLKNHCNNTVYFEKTVEVLKQALTGTFFNGKKDLSEYKGEKIDLEVWERSVSNFALLAHNDDYFPNNKAPLQSLYIHTFLYNPYGSERSMFIKCLTEEPKKKFQIRNDYHPEITEALKKICIDELKLPLTDRDGDLLVQASQRLMQYFDCNKNKIVDYVHNAKPRYKRIEILWEALKSRNKLNRITVYYFVSDITYNQTIPMYLRQKGLWNEY